MDFSIMGSEGYLPYTEVTAIRDEVLRTIYSQVKQTAVS
jgi:hypothetical protein